MALQNQRATRRIALPPGFRWAFASFRAASRGPGAAFIGLSKPPWQECGHERGTRRARVTSRAWKGDKQEKQLKLQQVVGHVLMTVLLSVPRLTVLAVIFAIGCVAAPPHQTACDSKSAGDACSFQNQDGGTVSDVCVTTADGNLECGSSHASGGGKDGGTGGGKSGGTGMGMGMGMSLSLIHI